jgi:hypothetical protein
MGKSINPMYHSFPTKGEAVPGSAPGLIVSMSLRPVIRWRVALLYCPPPLHRLDSEYHPPAALVNHHLTMAGEFSTGTMGNFQPELTPSRSRFCSARGQDPSRARPQDSGRSELVNLFQLLATTTVQVSKEGTL